MSKYRDPNNQWNGSRPFWTFYADPTFQFDYNSDPDMLRVLLLFHCKFHNVLMQKFHTLQKNLNQVLLDPKIIRNLTRIGSRSGAEMIWKVGSGSVMTRKVGSGSGSVITWRAGPGSVIIWQVGSGSERNSFESGALLYNQNIIFWQGWHVEAIDCSSSRLVYEGLQNMRNLHHLKYLGNASLYIQVFDQSCGSGSSQIRILFALLDPCQAT